MPAARLKHFGWGREGEGLTAEEEAFVIARMEARFGTALKESASAPRLEDIRLEAPRVAAPASLRFCTSEHYDRVAHTYGKSYPELARGLARDYASAPDVVAYPSNEADVNALLDFHSRFLLAARPGRVCVAASSRGATATRVRSRSTCDKWAR